MTDDSEDKAKSEESIEMLEMLKLLSRPSPNPSPPQSLAKSYKRRKQVIWTWADTM